MSKYPTSDEYDVLIKQWQELDAKGDVVARNRVGTIIFKGVESFLWHYVHKKMPRWKQEDKEEAFNEAAMILFEKAIPKYDLKKAEGRNGFTTYLMWWVRSAVGKYVDRSCLVKVDMNKRREAVRYVAKNEEVPEHLQKYLPVVVYADGPARSQHEGEPQSLWDVLAPKYNQVHHPEAEATVIQEDLANGTMGILMDLLDERSLFIVMERMKGNTLKSIGDKLGVTRERVRQLEAKAHERIRNKSGFDPAVLRR